MCIVYHYVNGIKKVAILNMTYKRVSRQYVGNIESIFKTYLPWQCAHFSYDQYGDCLL